MSHKKLTLHIAGMHCRSCDLLIEKNLSAVSGVKEVKAFHRKGIAEITYDREPNAQDLQRAVQAAGYSVGKAKAKPYVSTNPQDYLELVMVGALVAALYLFLAGFGVFDRSFEFGASPSFFVVFLVGLTAGVSTCMALIGGLVLGISARHAELHPEATRAQKFRPHLFFNIGRIISYALLGGIIGLVGSVFNPSGSLLGLFIIVAGAVMIFLGLKLIGIFPRLENKGFVLPTSIARFFGLNRETKEYSHRGALISGALTFFLPCGFTQAMQIYAVSTGSFAQGSLIMFLFALGTMPGLLGIGGLTSVLRGMWARHLFRFVGVIVIVLGLFNLRSGFNVAGLTLPSLPVSESETAGAAVAAKMEDGKQIIRMDQLPFSYNPNQFTIKKGVPVKWIINSTNPYTCAAHITIPSLGIARSLQQGINVIEFTPQRAGLLKFTCSMGMYSGVFNVIN